MDQFELTFDDVLEDKQYTTEITIHQGHLLKSSGREKGKPKGFQKRWFILSPTFVTYYKTEKVRAQLKKYLINIYLHFCISSFRM